MDIRIVVRTALFLAMAAVLSGGTNAIPYALTTCASIAACIGGTNTGSGPGVGGTSSSGSGVAGTTKLNSTASTAGYGIYGQDASTSGTNNAGVYGVSARGAGVAGKSTSNYGVRGASSQYIGVFGTGPIGVYGLSQAASGVGVRGIDAKASGFGLEGFSGIYGVYGQASTYGVYGINTNGTGVYGTASGGGFGGSFISNTGYGVYATSHSGFGLYGHSDIKTGAIISSSTNDGMIASGAYYGVLAKVAPADYALSAQDASGQNLFYVDGNGNVGYSGTLHSFLRTAQGGQMVALTTSALRPTIEDNGTAHLMNGRAVVTLDPAFARAIEGHDYRVILSPGGDTQGIYVASKGASRFVVQEVAGGHGTVTFDYFVNSSERLPVNTRSRNTRFVDDTRRSQMRSLPALPRTSGIESGSPAAIAVEPRIPYAVSACASAAPCLAGANLGSGPGIAGISSLGPGVSGVTKLNSTAMTAGYGIYGQDASSSGTNDAGVYGISVRGVGSSGKSTSNYGVRGTSTQNSGVYGTGVTGVYGTSSGSNAGVWGDASGSSSGTGAKGLGQLYGVYGTTTGGQSSSSVYGENIAAGTGVYGTSNGGSGGQFVSGLNTAVVATSKYGVGVQAHSTTSVGALFDSSSYYGAVIQGSPVALLTSTPSNGFPLVAQVANGGPTVFYVDDVGDVFYHGTLQQLLHTPQGDRPVAYGARATRESIEDAGTAQLIDGYTVVNLDATFAKAIAPNRTYRVFLTAHSESSGLYVAAKSPSHFTVREAQGGHGSFTFDYHVVAPVRPQLSPVRRPNHAPS